MVPREGPDVNKRRRRVDAAPGNNGPTAASDEWLYFQVHRAHVKPDGSLSSAAFAVDVLQVEVGSFLSKSDLRPDQVIVRLPASVARSLDLALVPAPTLFEQGRATVVGAKSRRARRALAVACERFAGT